MLESHITDPPLSNSPTSSSKPTIVIVQGSFQTPLIYEDLKNKLIAKGCSKTDKPDFPSKDLIDDALAVRSAVTRLVEYEKKKVVLVMHSYGGLVGSEAIPEELSYKYRKWKGLEGGLIHLFYFNAFILEEGKSVIGSFGESPNNIIHPNKTFTLAQPAKLLYNDLPPLSPKNGLQERYPNPTRCKKTVLTRAAWRYIPSTYLVGERNQAAPKEYQEMFAKIAGAKIERCGAGHSAMLSDCGMLVERILGAVVDAVKINE